MLRWAALFLGELRDGLTMINMQSAFLIVSKVVYHCKREPWNSYESRQRVQ